MEDRPRIAVLGGTGAQGRGLALRWADAGHAVVIGSRDASRAVQAALAIAERLSDRPHAVPPAGATNADAAAGAEVVVVSVPYTALCDTVTPLAGVLAGRLLVSVVVPLVPPLVSTFVLPAGGSAAVELRDMVGPGARVVAAFHGVAAAKLDRLGEDVGCDVLVCGDDDADKSTVISLARDAGAAAFDAGPLANAVVAEGLAAVLIAINKRYRARAAGIRITGVSR